MKVKIHTHPEGPSLTLPRDEIVSVLGLGGRFSDAYVGVLNDGDRYIMPIRDKVTPRTDTELLKAIAEMDLNPVYVDNIMDNSKITLMILDKQGLELWNYDYKKSEYSRLDALRDGVNFILDQEEL
tara:strand:+ start:33 stop:410 length:378 start_codon:yes stop_codon:yes gene_type:complete